MRKTFMDFKIISFRESPGGPVVRTLGFHCLGPGFNPRWGTKVPQAVRCGKKQNKTLYIYFYPFSLDFYLGMCFTMYIIDLYSGKCVLVIYCCKMIIPKLSN